MSHFFPSVKIRYLASQAYSLYFYSVSFQLRLSFSPLVSKNLNAKVINTADVSIAYSGEMTDLVISFCIPLGFFGKGLGIIKQIKQYRHESCPYTS